MLQAIVQETRGLAEVGTVVDLSCGLGQLAAAFAGIAVKCIGVDHDINTLKQALEQDKIQYIHSETEEICGLIAHVVLGLVPFAIVSGFYCTLMNYDYHWRGTIRITGLLALGKTILGPPNLMADFAGCLQEVLNST